MRDAEVHTSTRCIDEPHLGHISTSTAKTLAMSFDQDSRRPRNFGLSGSAGASDDAFSPQWEEEGASPYPGTTAARSFDLGAGGLLLLLTALDMLRAKAAECRCSSDEVNDARERDDIAIVPIAIPLLAGPGSMATVMMLVSKDPTWGGIASVLAAVVVTFVVSYWVLRSASVIQRVLGASAMGALQRVLGLVLAAMSIQFIVDGATRMF